MQGQPEKLKLQLETVPARTGVYVFKDAAGSVLYVGKAGNLRNRVRSHFQEGDAFGGKARLMASQVSSVEVIATDSELEALILESNLIKRYRPPYNVRLRDDKKYPYLKITLNEEFPARVVVREMQEDGARYFGPYANTKAMWQTVRHVTRMFKVRPRYESGTQRAGCPWKPPKQRRPCLYYHIGECSAPCDRLISTEEYRHSALQAAMFLDGRGERLLEALRQRMDELSKALQFEAAARMRDQLHAVERSLEQQKIVLPGAGDADVLGIGLQEDIGCVVVLQIRRGRLIGHDRHVIEGVSGMEEDQALGGFMEQYYQRAAFVPPVVLVGIRLREAVLVGRWLARRRGSKVTVSVPQRGVKRALVGMAQDNARVQLQQLLEQESLRKTRGKQAIGDLARILGLPLPPARIEAFDISSIAASESVGSMVVFENGEPKKSDYRRFKIRFEKGVPDDFAMMREVLERRLRAAATPKFAKLPDLILVDGGRPQLTAALTAMNELSISIPCAALAKRHEEIYVPERAAPVILAAHSRALQLLQRMRDEAHRFAQAYHHTLRARQTRRSLLDEIPGVGPQRKAALLTHFRSLRRLREASVEEIAAVPGVGRAAAQAIVDHLRAQASKEGER